MKLTAKQYSVLLRLGTYPAGAPVREIAQMLNDKHPYIARAQKRNVLNNLAGKGLCRIVHFRPNRYQVTERGEWLLVQRTRSAGPPVYSNGSIAECDPFLPASV
ncbi:hypothetical protein [Brucella intermedia]|uniref:hypothetical protein n=1 Tax=Brucella intermedia TaxID=94625 RepID=UPI00224A885E|nr:hypothetical protein [Brucella intermedia]